MSRLSFSLEPRGFAIISGLLFTALFAWMAISPLPYISTLLKRFDYISYDVRLNMLLSSTPSPRNHIVIVDIDEKSLQAEGHWPWSREKLARLTEKLFSDGATVVAFDMLFPEKESNIAQTLLTHLEKDKLVTIDTAMAIRQITPLFDYDADFAKVLAAKKDAVVLGIFFSGNKTKPSGMLPPPVVDLTKIDASDVNLPAMQTYVSNIPILQKAANHAGALSVIPDEDGTIRRYALLQRYGDFLYPSLALEAVRLYLLEPKLSINTVSIGKEKVVDAVTLGQSRIATDDDGRVFIPYLGVSQSFPYYSATDVLNNKLPKDQLGNALVFVGTSAVGLGDMRSTPVQSVYPGVEIHASVAEALFFNHFPYVPAWAPGAELSLLVFSGCFLAVLFAYIGPGWIVLLTLIFNSAIFFGRVWLFKNTDMVLPVVLPLLEILTLAIFNMAYGFFTESMRRYELKRVFEQYVPSGRVEEIIKNPQAINTFEGERKVMSVLFMDIRNFTMIAEKLAINELKKLLNFILTEMTSVIFNHGGTIDKYVGDMIMAFWGAPLSDREHAKHAILAALDMQNTLEKLQPKLADMQLPAVRIGVGINTGMMDVGDMGSTFRRAYTVLGDAVNLASRLESLTKYYGVGIIVGENTVSGQDEFIFRQIDKVKVKGKNEGIAIYEPLGLQAAISKNRLDELESYHKALLVYFQGNWPTALKLFEQLQQQFPTVVLYQIYLARIREFLQNPPAYWEGIWEHHEK